MVLEFLFKHKDTLEIYGYSKEDLEKIARAAQGGAVPRDYYTMAEVMPYLIPLTKEERVEYVDSFKEKPKETGIGRYL